MASENIKPSKEGQIQLGFQDMTSRATRGICLGVLLNGAKLMMDNYQAGNSTQELLGAALVIGGFCAYGALGPKSFN